MSVKLSHSQAIIKNKGQPVQAEPSQQLAGRQATTLTSARMYILYKPFCYNFEVANHNAI